MKSKSPFWIWLTMALLALSVIAFVAARPLSAFAQSATPKVGNKPLVQIKPQPPMGCMLVGTVKGTKLWAGDCVAATELRGTAETVLGSPPSQAAGANPRGQKQ
jgi:hypothetical protein